MYRKISLLIAIFAVFSASLTAQDENRVAGSWMGRLDLGAVQLRLGFNISVGDDGALSATMDSPDQGAKGIPMGEVSFVNDSLVIKAPMIAGAYRGLMVHPDSINGIWKQGGRVFDLDIARQPGEIVLNRPQEPMPPFPYAEEEVSFTNAGAGVTLAGTLTIPYGDGPFPGVVLVTGSGQQNRDEEIFGHKPFKVIADHLTRNGIAVLRYNDRGVPPSGGSAVGATSADFAGDAAAAVAYLRGRSETDASPVGVIGHSEGGLIAMILGAGENPPDFLVMLAGPGTTGRQILLDQSEYISRESGMPETTIALNTRINSGIYDIMIEEADPSAGGKRIALHVRSMLEAEGTAEDIISKVVENVTAELGPAGYPWMRYFIMSDPSELLPRISVPLLALNGEKDCQVLAGPNLDAIDAVLSDSGHKDYRVIALPDLNHLFQHSSTGLVNEYVEIEETISPEVLEIIAKWIVGVCHPDCVSRSLGEG